MNSWFSTAQLGLHHFSTVQEHLYQISGSLVPLTDSLRAYLGQTKFIVVQNSAELRGTWGWYLCRPGCNVQVQPLSTEMGSLSLSLSLLGCLCLKSVNGGVNFLHQQQQLSVCIKLLLIKCQSSAATGPAIWHQLSSF